jgi:hypothetical protein
MKKVLIISDCFIPSGEPGEMKVAYKDSVINVDDDVADNLLAGQRARIADKDAKPVDKTKEREAAQEQAKQAEVANPLAVAVAAGVAEALRAMGVTPKAEAPQKAPT